MISFGCLLMFAPFFLRMEKIWEHFCGHPHQNSRPNSCHKVDFFLSWIKVFLFTCQTGPTQNKARLQNRSSVALGNIHLTYARMFMEFPAATQPERGGTHNHQPQLEHLHQHHKDSAAKTRQHWPIHTRTAKIIKHTRCPKLCAHYVTWLCPLRSRATFRTLEMCLHKSQWERPSSITQTHEVPVRVTTTVREGDGQLPPPNINVPSTRTQKLVHENPMSHNWPPETNVSLGDQLVYEVPYRFSSKIFLPAIYLAVFP